MPRTSSLLVEMPEQCCPDPESLCKIFHGSVSVAECHAIIAEIVVNCAQERMLPELFSISSKGRFSEFQGFFVTV